MEKLRDACLFTCIAKEVDISASSVIRIYDRISYPGLRQLPKAVAIDEFIGNIRGEKYQALSSYSNYWKKTYNLTDCGADKNFLPEKQYRHCICNAGTVYGTI